MADKDIKMLVKAIGDYLKWVKSLEEHGRSRHTIRYPHILTDFLVFVIEKDIAWKDMFTFETLIAFRKYSSFKQTSRALKYLSVFLYNHGIIDQPIEEEVPEINTPMPDNYENYLRYREHGQQISPSHLRQTKRLLGCLHEYLEIKGASLSALKIEHLDELMDQFKVAHSTLKLYRSTLRGFVKYLYNQKIIKRDLAPLLGGPPQYLRRRRRP